MLCFIHIIGMFYTECCPVLIGQNQQKHEKHIEFFPGVSFMHECISHTYYSFHIFFFFFGSLLVLIFPKYTFQGNLNIQYKLMIMISFTVQYKHLLPCEGLCLTVGPQGDCETQSLPNLQDNHCLTGEIVMEQKCDRYLYHNIQQSHSLVMPERFEIPIATQKYSTLILLVTLFIIVKNCPAAKMPFRR